jgi:hypothetical protein
MAVVADINSIDLVVEPHEFSPEEREALRRAVEERRRQHRDPKLVQEFAKLLKRHCAEVEPDA